MTPIKKTFQYGSFPVTLETGEIARQADGAVLVNMGDTVVLVTVVAAVENMPDGKAYRPGDVITSMSGKTIEVLNTDAEGRLALCDALTYSERFEPAAIIDVATLTGACMVALGLEIAGLFGTGEGPDLVAAAAEQAGERVWPLPIPEDYRRKIDSDVADMKNIGGIRHAFEVNQAVENASGGAREALQATLQRGRRRG